MPEPTIGQRIVQEWLAIDDYWDQLAERIDAAIAEAQRLPLAALSSMQWCSMHDGVMGCCPACGNHRQKGHNVACRIGLALGTAAQQDIKPSELLPAEQRGLHPYTSTACLHGLHARCRLSCKFCAAPCMCECHARAKTEGERK